jgi:NADH-quinone oxidoreductase subunit B
VLGEPIRVELDLGPGHGQRCALWVFNVGLACCAVEFVATAMGRHDFVHAGAMPFAARPQRADVLVISGTLTDRMAPGIKRLYDELPGPTFVVSFGACANSGGPYWDSYSVTKGVDQLLPVDVYVPGCPPRPEALLHGLAVLQHKLAAASAPARPRDRAYEVAALTAPLVHPPQGTVQ